MYRKWVELRVIGLWALHKQVGFLRALNIKIIMLPLLYSNRSNSLRFLIIMMGNKSRFYRKMSLKKWWWDPVPQFKPWKHSKTLLMGKEIFWTMNFQSRFLTILLKLRNRCMDFLFSIEVLSSKNLWLTHQRLKLLLITIRQPEVILLLPDLEPNLRLPKRYPNRKQRRLKKKIGIK